jgi:hypothetical protein
LGCHDFAYVMMLFVISVVKTIFLLTSTASFFFLKSTKVIINFQVLKLTVIG